MPRSQRDVTFCRRLQLEFSEPGVSLVCCAWLLWFFLAVYFHDLEVFNLVFCLYRCRKTAHLPSHLKCICMQTGFVITESEEAFVTPGVL